MRTRSVSAKIILTVLLGFLVSCAKPLPIPKTESAAIRIDGSNKSYGMLIGGPPESSRALVATYGYKPGLKVDIYWPPDFMFDRPLPLALFIVSFADSKVRKDTGSSATELATYVSWCAAAASNGMAACIMTVTQSTKDLPALVAYLEKEKRNLRIDTSRVFIWACSSNGISAATLAAKGGALAGRVRGMSLYYTGMSVMSPVPLPQVAVEVVFADKDSAGTMKQLESYAKSLAANGNATRLVHSTTGYHSFDTLQDTPETRGIVAGTLAFMVESLKADSP